MSKPKFAFTVITCTLAATCLVLLGIGQLLSDEWTVSTQRTLPATSERVAPLLRDFERWAEWSVWDIQLGNPTTQRIEGEPGTPEHRWIWQGPLGDATMSTTRADATSHEFTLAFRYGDSGESYGGKFRGEIRWRAVGDQTEVTWTETNRVGRLIDRWAMWFGALQDKVQQVQRASLTGLEEYLRRSAEGGAPK